MAVNIETMPLLPQFLRGNYEDEGIDFSAVVSRRRARLTQERRELAQEVAGKTIKLLIADWRDFPLIDIPDPSGEIMVPTKLVLRRFTEVTRRNLLAAGASSYTLHEASVDLTSPHKEDPESSRKLGNLSMSSHQAYCEVDTIYLGRPGFTGDEEVRPDMGSTDNPEALLFLAHTYKYLQLLAHV